MKRSRRKRKAQLRRLPGVLLPGAFLPHAFLPVSNSFSTTLRPVYLNRVTPRGDLQHTLPYERHLHLMRYYACLVAAREQRPHGLPAGLAVV